MREFVKLSVTLFVITAAVALVLALGNSVTSERIKALSDDANKSAQTEVLKDVGKIDTASAQQIEYNKEGSTVTAITKYQKQDGGVVFAISCSPRGYGGEIPMMVGVNDDLSITNINIIDSANETPGLGSEIGKVEFYSQFVGKSSNIILSQNAPTDNEVQAVTGATVSSKAVVKGVNDALAAAEEVLNK